jgi:hypothetical protein
MSAFPSLVSVIEVTAGAAVVLAVEGADGGSWLGSKPPQGLQLCSSEMRSGGCDAYDVTPFEGCVAIVDDGGCSYETKAANAAAAGASGILVVAADDDVAVMGCRTCQALHMFGSMISRSDGQRLRRAIDSDASARIMSVARLCAAFSSASRAAGQVHVCPSPPLRRRHRQQRMRTPGQRGRPRSAPLPPPPPPQPTSSRCPHCLPHLALRYHSLLARRRREVLASLSPAQLLQVLLLP